MQQNYSFSLEKRIKNSVRCSTDQISRPFYKQQSFMKLQKIKEIFQSVLM